MNKKEAQEALETLEQAPHLYDTPKLYILQDLHSLQNGLAQRHFLEIFGKETGEHLWRRYLQHNHNLLTFYAGLDEKTRSEMDMMTEIILMARVQGTNVHDALKNYYGGNN